MEEATLSKSFVFFDSFLNVSKKMTEEDRRVFIDSVIEYGINGIEPDSLPYHLDLVFDQVKATIDGNKRKYQTKVENGKKGGAPKGNANAKKQPKTTEKQPKTTEEQPKSTEKQPKTTGKQHNVNGNVNVNDNDISNLHWKCGEPEEKRSEAFSSASPTGEQLPADFVEWKSEMSTYHGKPARTYLNTEGALSLWVSQD